jgi:hypothetical protein
MGNIIISVILAEFILPLIACKRNMKLRSAFAGAAVAGTGVGLLVNFLDNLVGMTSVSTILADVVFIGLLSFTPFFLKTWRNDPAIERIK